jgi:iron-sulfur cluster assembly protein/iron-sulfur cluster insertion protein
MFFDTDQTSDDLEEAYGTVRVVVDPASAELLVGAILDYQEGLEQSGFSINNPDASHSCGCGKN